MTYFAAGVVDGLFPAPVLVDSVHDMEQWLSSAELEGVYSDVNLVNSFIDSSYSEASCSGISENDFLVLKSKKLVSEGFNLVITKRYTHENIVSISGNIDQFFDQISKHNVKGTLVITFKKYPYGFDGIADTVKQFRIVF